MMITAEVLRAIKVLYLVPDHLSLYGIQYLMRSEIGQEPRHIWEFAREHGRPLSGWIWLGTPGWFGSMNEEEIALVKAFLAEHESKIPGHPNEWCEL